MKKFVAVCCVWAWHGLNVFGQAQPPMPPNPPGPQLHGHRPAPRVKAANIMLDSPMAVLSPSMEIQPAQSAAFRRIDRDNLLTPQISKNPGAALTTLFPAENGQSGEAGIRDPLVVIFPSGH